MYKNEAVFRGALVTVLRNKGWEVQPIEVGGINCGVPDLYMIKNGVEIWAELKNMYQCAKNLLTIDFRKGQQAWLYRHAKQGGISAVIIATSDWIVVHRYRELLKNDTLLLTRQDVMLCKTSNISSILEGIKEL